jgi:hypothetical protein
MSETSEKSDKMSDRYAEMAWKSAVEAEAAYRRAQMACDAEDPRPAKRARREAAEWADTATRDAMRAHGAYSAETGEFDAKHARADEAMSKANKARDMAVEAYRQMKAGGGD